VVELLGNAVKIVGGVDGQGGALGEVLAQQAVGDGDAVILGQEPAPRPVRGRQRASHRHRDHDEPQLLDTPTSSTPLCPA
jgi:hypothetical protein